MSKQRAELVEEPETHVQRLRELRHYTQDASQLRDIAVELATLRTTLSDSTQLDAAGLRRLLDQQRSQGRE